eukprot:1528-Heterococcus_DN1.PRE.4
MFVTLLHQTDTTLLQATTSTTSSTSTITNDVTGEDATADNDEYDYGGDADTSYNSTDDTTQSLPLRGKSEDLVAPPTVVRRVRQRADAPNAVINAQSTHITLPYGWDIAAEAPAAAAIGATEREQKMLLKQRVLVMMTASGSTDSDPEPLVWREYTVSRYNRAGMGAKRIEGCEKMLWVITAVADTSIEYAIDLRKKYHDGINSSAAVQFGSWMHMISETRRMSEQSAAITL